MKRAVIVIMLLVVALTGCGKKTSDVVATETTETIITEKPTEEKEVPFEKAQILDYSKIGEETFLIIGTSMSDCQKYLIDIEQTYLDAMMTARPYIDIKVKYEQKAVVNNKNEDLYNTEDVGAIEDNKDELGLGSISDWEFYDGKDLGKLDLTAVTKYLREKYSLPTDEDELVKHTMTVKSIDKITDTPGEECLKLVDENGFVFYDYDMNNETEYEVGKQVEINTFYTVFDNEEQPTNPMMQTFIVDGEAYE